MLSNRPLFATAADQQWFVWTRPANELRRALVLGRNTLVIGTHGSGKTSTLHMVEHSLRENQSRQVTFVSLAGLDDPSAVVPAVHAAAVERNWLPPPSPETLRSVREGFDPLAPTRLLRQLRDCPRGAIFMLDDVSAAAGVVLFGRLRDELWQLPLHWAVATLPDDAAALVTAPADAFFERRVILGEFDEKERLNLLRARLKGRRERLTANRAKALAAMGPGNPRQLIELARDAHASDATPEALASAVERRRDAAEAAAGRPGAVVVSGMEGLGPVAAADPLLLDRLGWDRPRAARTLSKLEQAGVVRSFLEPREGRIGRPRKLYALTPPSEFAKR